MPSLANLRRHFDAVRSVQSSRAAISWSLNPSPANSTILARITSRYGRVYWPARRTNSRPSLSLIATAAIADEVRRRYSNSFKPRRTYFREPVLAVLPATHYRWPSASRGQMWVVGQEADEGTLAAAARTSYPLSTTLAATSHSVTHNVRSSRQRHQIRCETAARLRRRVTYDIPRRNTDPAC